MCVRSRKETKKTFFFAMCCSEGNTSVGRNKTDKKNPLTGLTVKLRLVIGKLLFSYSTVLCYGTVTGTLLKLMAKFIFITCLVTDTHTGGNFEHWVHTKKPNFSTQTNENSSL